MSIPFAAALPLLALLAGTAAAQPSSPSGASASAHRTVALPVWGQRELPELPISPDQLTALLFGAPLKLAGANLDEREQFSRVTVLEDALLLVPSRALEPGTRLRLRVRFVEGILPASAEFVLVVDAARAEPQVNVELASPVPDACWHEAEVERVKARQCQAELARERAKPEGLTGLLASGQLDAKGIRAQKLPPRQLLALRPGEPLRVTDATSYLAPGRVAVELWVDNLSARPWTAAGAQLVGEGGMRLKVLRVWSPEPLPPGAKRQRVVVEAEAAEGEARGRFTLSLWQEGESPGLSVAGVAFP